ncbi:ATP:cob(I)alamin adenosyltransferase [Melghirimyces profundicolus]|uniref:Corrinoid adenosyltransferase n=1 Tax=Melghirimyces profundicolus TaxID=1242148 RepID=A0A2T6C8C5_9BACL|nr:cob(I)yrinic acid a,c-diamide adenosyltransferase [Melghirimyces profundicolus]PTX64562.1 ATP:cob(I)alamin adenosyltransferase [Melghirimyces profundicolus]
MKIYTRRGDEGQTAVIGARVSKDDVRVEAYGTVDEANSFVGDAIARMRERDGQKYSDLIEVLTQIQQELFDVGSDLAVVKGKRPYKITAEHVDRLEEWVDRCLQEAPSVKKFILPGGTPVASSLHICRTVVRRAERRAVTLTLNDEINHEARRYLNRLSDLFFALARAANAREKIEDIQYERGREVFRNRSRRETRRRDDGLPGS